MTEKTCEHLETVDIDLAGRVEGVCEECLVEGTRWVHLRVCKTCGHVGCCDSSPRRHARAHAEESGHPIIGPIETPKSGWLWCYPHDDYVTR